MKIKTKLYIEQQKDWPQTGQHIMAQYNEESVIVYQSYRPEIGLYAAKNQCFGGAFSLDRMTWIKPNFLWMMYRNGWGTKEGQEIVLAIHLKRSVFENYVSKAVYSSFKRDKYQDKEDWQRQVKQSNIRLQWDPDHDPYGAKLERRAIQIGIRNKDIEEYASEAILQIDDISDFVKEQHQHVLNHDLDKLLIPEEKPYVPEKELVSTHLGVGFVDWGIILLW